MFSPGTKPRRDRASSPATPLSDLRCLSNRPSTGTPAPWAPRLSVLARVSQNDKADEIKPVYVGEFPQPLRDEQASSTKHLHGDASSVSGGMERGASLAWILCGARLFVWSFLSPATSCVALEIPASVLEGGTSSSSSSWMMRAVSWDDVSSRKEKAAAKKRQCRSVGVVLCNRKTRAVVYWSDIYSEGSGDSPVVSLASADELEVAATSPVDRKTPQRRQQLLSRHRSSLTGLSTFNSLIACVVSDSSFECVAVACSSNGELWQFNCSVAGVSRKRVYRDNQGSISQGGDTGVKGYPRSLTWCVPNPNVQESSREFIFLTELEIQCFSIGVSPDYVVSKLWSHEIIGPDGEKGIKKDLAGQKRIWPLDIQVDYHGKVATILVAIICLDRGSGSSYTQYSLVTLHNKSGGSIVSTQETVLERKDPIQVIIPKARIEDEDFLFSMKLRVGGKPSGSAIILSGDRTATVSHYYRGTTRLYKFDLPYDAGKVLDASILPATDDGEEGAWVVLTEKAGIWAIPEKAVMIGGVEPPERSLSRKGSSNEGSAQEDRKNLSFAGNLAPRRASSEAWDAGERQRVMPVVARPSAQDEESEALLNQLFHDYHLHGKVDASLEKLKDVGVFDRDRETNVFARLSKSIVDTLAKHWTTTRGAEILAMAVVSSQLTDKQQKHTKFLEFLALSKCHEELCSRQRHSLQIILEHGEKLAGMIQLRELQNIISQNRTSGLSTSRPSPENQISDALWDLIQLVGDRARRSTVLLMDRDNAEVFYSKVSDLQEVFSCLDKQLEYVIPAEQQFGIQVQRACELSNACVRIVRAAMEYRNTHHLWYPPPEGLTPWYCQLVVRNGMWQLASLMLQLLKEASQIDVSAKSDLYSHLEVLAEVLLESYAGSVTAIVELGQENKGLMDEYWNRRDVLLDSLYHQAKDFVEVDHENLNDGSDDINDELLGKLSLSLLPMAKRHECYSTLWKICCGINDSELLKNLMHDSMGPNGGFSYYVFKQLYARKQFSTLLRLGEDFHEALSTFLKYHPDLLWLHELFLHQFSSASETLHELALSQEQNSFSEVEGGTDPGHLTTLLKLGDRKRLLNLSKIAAIAGKDADCENKVKRIEADLKILKLQEEVVKLSSVESKKNLDKHLLNPEDLIKLCLGSENVELSLRAFDVFAWTSSDFRRTHANLLEDCWRNVADQDDWSKLYQASVSEGWGDEETLHNLKDTLLFQASSKCYGPDADIFGEGFDEVLTLRQETVEPSTMKDVSSVEAILMQHRDYSEAGKLMLTAIMLGSSQYDTIEEGSPVPME